MAVRDLSSLVKPEDVISTEQLTTLLAIVSKFSQKDWLSSYETLTTYVVILVPRCEMLSLFMQTAVVEYLPVVGYVPRNKAASCDHQT